VANTRILTVNVSRLLRGVVGGIVSGHAGLEIVGDAGVDDLLSAIDALHPGVVVLGTGDDAAASAEALTLLRARHPGLRVVGIDRDGRSATVHRPGVVRCVVAEVSPAVLLQMLRGFDD
jgi:DNA-binding NarL/FixJ family response regulator